MKRINKFAILFLCLFIALLPGCGEKNKPADSPANAKTVKLFSPGEPWEGMVAGMKDFQKETGIKIDLKVIPPLDIEKMNLMTIAAGNGPDVFNLHMGNFPTCTVRNLVQPLENYLDISNPIFNKSVTDTYVWKNKHYAVNDSVSPVFIIYNKSMFDNAGLTSPLEFYKQGKWNFENFKQSGMALTQDSNRDGQTDVYGFSTWQYEAFALSNGGDLVNIRQSDGKIELSFKTTETITALNFLQDACFKDKYMNPTGRDTFKPDFISGKVAMITGDAPGLNAIAKTVKENKSFEYGIVPFPTGLQGNGNIPGNSWGYGIASNAKNPEGAAKWLTYWLKYNTDWQKRMEKENPNTNITKEELKIIDDVMNSGKVVSSIFNGIGSLWTKQQSFWKELLAGTPFTTAYETHSPTFQAEIDLLMSSTVITKALPFNAPPVIDFEDGKISDLLTTDKCEPSTDNGSGGISITSDPKEVISGKYSLKVLTSTDAKVDIARYFRTNSSVLNIPSLRNYKISFKYKVTKDCGDGGVYFADVRPSEGIITGAGALGSTQLDGMFAGDEGEEEVTVFIDSLSKENSFIFWGKKAGEIVIDDIKIVEAPAE